MVALMVTMLSGTPACNEPAPEDMVCIPAGPATIGSDTGRAIESPPHQVEISDFFIDRFEVTNGDYDRCVADGGCPGRPRMPPNYRRFLGDEQPAVPISWPMADAYCVWSGKRLPTEAEWEKVARGGGHQSYPWGDEAPSCDRAHYRGCEPDITRDVGELGDGVYGVSDMAGNGYEWVNDWASACYGGCRAECGSACQGQDPQGPCGGLRSCPERKRRVLKGGSWYWGPRHLRAAHRRAQRPRSGLHRFSFRCASDTAILARPPYWHHRRRDTPPRPNPPSAEELAIATAIRDDEDVQDIRPCSRQGMATHRCRDPLSYVRSNEARRGAFELYIENLSGGYVGLGSDQSYDYISSAKSRWAWIFDYDLAVIRTHRIIHAIIARAGDPDAFVSAFLPRNRRRTHTWIVQSLQERPEEISPTLQVFYRYRTKFHKYFLRSSRARRGRRFGWLQHPENYAYVRDLIGQGRVVVRAGNLLTPGTIEEIGNAARRLNVPINVYYESNAASQWSLTDRYRQNVQSLPFGSHGVALRTHFQSRDKERGVRWTYVIHYGEHLQRVLARMKPVKLESLIDMSLPGDQPHIRLIGLPGQRVESTELAGH